MLGYAVIDTETTGLNIWHNDRIIEIGVVLLNESLQITGMYETVLNPERDLGLVSLHGIDGLIASEGASFKDIMHSLASLLHDRVIVGQNVKFDVGMIECEYKKENLFPDCGEPIDTLQIAKSLRLPVSNHKLETLCRHFGVPLLDGHQAMADAIATAQLFVAMIAQHRPQLYAAPADFRGSPQWDNFSAWKTRFEIHGKLAQPAHLEDAVSRLHDSALDLPQKSIDEYLKTMHVSLLNGRFSVRERNAMEALMNRLSLTKSHVIDLHEEYIFMLICKNLAKYNNSWQESYITEHIAVASSFTGVKKHTVDDLLQQTLQQNHLIVPTAEKLNSYFSLKQGDAFTVTGEDFEYSKEHWVDSLKEQGLIYKDSTTKASKLVIASDPYSLSSKAVTARKYGIPVLNESTVNKMLNP